MDEIELRVIGGPHTGHSVRVPRSGLVIGRTSAADVVLDQDPLISSRHFSIHADGNTWLFRDLESRNGTRVNGQPVSSGALQDGDQFSAGSTVFQVSCGTDAASPQSMSDRQASPTPNGQAEAGSSAGFDPFDSYRPGVVKPQREVARTLTAEPVDEGAVGLLISQVRLRILSSVETGTVNWLGPGHALTFGRSGRADCVFDFDSAMSGVHFRVTCDSEQCSLEDLESTSGTWLNGHKVVRSHLYHGDRIRAGSTEFLVEVEGATGAIDRPADLAVGSSQLATDVSSLPWSAKRTKCRSGLHRLLGRVPDETPIDHLVSALATLAPTYLLVDYSRLGSAVIAELKHPTETLFPWLPAEAALKMPVLLAPEDVPGWQSLVIKGWGQDAVIMLQSEQPKAKLLETLRALIGGQEGPESGRGIVGVCWPVVLETILLHNAHGFADQLFEDVLHVFMESPQDVACWQGFGSSEATQRLTGLGLSIIDDEDVAAPADVDGSHA